MFGLRPLFRPGLHTSCASRATAVKTGRSPPPQAEQLQALVTIRNGVIDAVKAASDLGAAGLVEAGKLRKSGDLYFAVETQP